MQGAKGRRRCRKSGAGARACAYPSGASAESSCLLGYNIGQVKLAHEAVMKGAYVTLSSSKSCAAASSHSPPLRLEEDPFRHVARCQSGCPAFRRTQRAHWGGTSRLSARYPRYQLDQAEQALADRRLGRGQGQGHDA